jgi:hypothetical protein
MSSMVACENDPLSPWSNLVYFLTGALCPSLPNPVNGMVSWTNLSENGLATYICNDGYERIGDSVRRCQRGVMWGGEEPLCTGSYA